MEPGRRDGAVEVLSVAFCPYGGRAVRPALNKEGNVRLINYPHSVRELTCYRHGFRMDYFNWDGEWCMDAPENIPVGSCVRIDYPGMTVNPFCAIEWTYRELL